MKSFGFSPVRWLHRETSHGCDGFRLFVFRFQRANSGKCYGVSELLYTWPMSHLNSDCLLKRFDSRRTWRTRQFVVAYWSWFVAQQSSNAFLDCITDCRKIIPALQSQNHLKYEGIFLDNES